MYGLSGRSTVAIDHIEWLQGLVRKAEEEKVALQAAADVHRDTAVAWRKRAEDAEAENVEMRDRWSKKAHELHQARQRITELQTRVEYLESTLIVTAAELKLSRFCNKKAAPADERAAQDAAIGRIIKEI